MTPDRTPDRNATVPAAFPALGSEPSRSRDAWAVALAVALLGAAAAIVAVAPSPWVRRLIPVALAAGAVSVLARRLVTDTAPGWRGVRIDARGRLVHVGRGGADVARIDLRKPFGVTWLADRARERAVLAITGDGGAMYLGARFSADERRAHASLLGRAATLPDEEPALEPVGEAGAPLRFAARTLARLDAALAAIDPGARDRCLLSDTRGDAVSLDRDELRVGHLAFDLASPLEWRALLFQETLGAGAPVASDRQAEPHPGTVVMVYQGTWIRQAERETILVSLLPPLGAPATAPREAPESPEIERAVLRDLRLMQAAPELPPPRALRVGIERAYMLRLRVALDRAPRPRRSGRASDAPLC